MNSGGHNQPLLLMVHGGGVEYTLNTHVFSLSYHKPYAPSQHALL